MVEIRLHGALAIQFGKVWELDVPTIQMAVDAIDRARGGFRRAIMKLDAEGMVFRVRRRTEDLDNETVMTALAPIDRVDIIPIVKTAGAGARFVIGAILTYAGYVVSVIPGFQPLGMAMISVGASLMIGAISEWLAPRPKQKEESQAVKSWAISGPLNTADQGQCIPLIYGEVLTGSIPISAGLRTTQMTPSGSVDAGAQIGGNFEQSFYSGAQSGITYFDAVYSVGVFNIVDPLTYQWSISNLVSAAESVVLINPNSASVTVRYGYELSEQDVGKETSFTLSCEVTGKRPYGNPPSDVSFTTSHIVQSYAVGTGYGRN